MKLWQQPEFRDGQRDMLGISLGLAAWGLVTGVAMIKSGLALPVAILMSLLVFAGSAQLAALPLIASGAPIWVVWAAAFCVNLRFLIFSVQWRPYFAHLPRHVRAAAIYFSADLNYVAFMKRYPEPRAEPGQLAYFMGGVSINWPSWQLASLIGMLAADRVPTSWGLGFAGTLALLGMTYSLFTDRFTWIAGVVAGTAAVAAYALPLRLNIVIAIAAAVLVGVVMDQATAKRAGA